MFSIAGISEAVYNHTKKDWTDFLRYKLDDAIKSNVDPVGYLVHEYTTPSSVYFVKKRRSPEQEERLQKALFKALEPFRGAMLAARDYFRSKSAKENEVIEAKQEMRFRRIANGELPNIPPVSGPFDAFEALWPEEQEELDRKRMCRRIRLKLNTGEELLPEEEAFLESEAAE